MENIHFGKLVFEQAKKYGERIALRYRDSEIKKWYGITWNELSEQVFSIAKSLLDMGIKEQQNVAIFSQNKYEIIVADFALHANKAVAIPVYATSTAEQILYIVEDAQIEVMFVGDQYQYDVAMEVLQHSRYLKTIIAISEEIDLKGNIDAVRYQCLLEKGRKIKDEAKINERIESLSYNDLATIMYTSGTTGEPKGVMLSHNNYAEAMRIHSIRLPMIGENDVSISFLPLTHVFERAWTYYCLYRGVRIDINEKPQEIQQIIQEVRPTAMCAVPRFWEKVYAAVQEKIETSPQPLKKIFIWSIAVGRRYNISYVRIEKKAPLCLRLKYKIVNKTIFQLLKKAIGVENGVLFPCAGAYLSDEINTFLHSVGINICMGYGLTETTATVSCFNPYNKQYRIGTVGDIMPDVQVKISDEGEILVKGKTVTEGYYNKPEITAETIVDGWFHTGDAGSIDEHGCLIIKERIKDLFKTSGGKYVAPQQIETKLGEDKYIEQVAVIGDQRKYISALIVPAFEQLKKYAKENEILYENEEDLVKNRRINDFIEERIGFLQKDLARFEQVKKFTLLPKLFSAENGELTLTLKLKRKEITKKYKKIIDNMYPAD